MDNIADLEKHLEYQLDSLVRDVRGQEKLLTGQRLGILDADSDIRDKLETHTRNCVEYIDIVMKSTINRLEHIKKVREMIKKEIEQRKEASNEKPIKNSLF